MPLKVCENSECVFVKNEDYGLIKDLSNPHPTCACVNKG